MKCSLRRIALALWLLLIVSTFIGAGALSARAQDTTLCLDVSSIKTDKGVNFNLKWSICVDNVELEKPPGNFIAYYWVYCQTKPDGIWIPADSARVDGRMDFTFANKEYRKAYRFQVKGYDSGGNPKREKLSDTLFVVRAEEQDTESIRHFYDNATDFGKAAGIAILLLFAFGFFYITYNKTWSVMRSKNIFLGHFVSTMEKYEKNPSEEATDDHDSAIKEFVSKITGNNNNNKSKIIIGLRKGKINISKIGIFESNRLTAISKIFDSIMMVITLRWLLRLFGIRQYRRFDELPVYNIIDSALDETTKSNPNVAKALSTAVEDEELKLRERSFIDVIWGIGAVSPLLGLFGTVTGLINSFGNIGELPEQTTPKEILRILGGGIYEALGTTFMGLFAGILLMLCYYYYNYKYERTIAIWKSLQKNLQRHLTR